MIMAAISIASRNSPTSTATSMNARVSAFTIISPGIVLLKSVVEVVMCGGSSCVVTTKGCVVRGICKKTTKLDSWRVEIIVAQQFSRGWTDYALATVNNIHQLLFDKATLSC